MSDPINGGPAFPVPDDAWDMPGMTLRDYFAAQVIQGFAATDREWADGSLGAAKAAYRWADQMLIARTK